MILFNTLIYSLLALFFLTFVRSETKLSFKWKGPENITHGQSFDVSVKIKNKGGNTLKKASLILEVSNVIVENLHEDCTYDSGLVSCLLPSIKPKKSKGFDFHFIDNFSSNFKQTIKGSVTQGELLASSNFKIVVIDPELEMIETCPTLSSYLCDEYSCCGWDEEKSTCDVICSSFWSKDRCLMKNECAWHRELNSCVPFTCEVLSKEDCDTHPNCRFDSRWDSCGVLNCGVLQKEDCKGESLCSWSKETSSCHSFTCSSISDAQLCHDIEGISCYWDGEKCFDDKCHPLSKKKCNNKAGECFWASDFEKCVPFTCSLLSQGECKNTPQCSWSDVYSVCQNYRCSNLDQTQCLGNYSCYWNVTHNWCEDLGCHAYMSDKDTCLSFDDTLHCTWEEKCLNYNCSIVTDETSCKSKYWCEWKDNRCKNEDCGVPNNREDCILMAQCAWSGSFCYPRDCTYYVYQSSCSRLPYCSWNTKCFSFPCIWYNHDSCDKSPYCQWNELCESCMKDMLPEEEEEE